MKRIKEYKVRHRYNKKQFFVACILIIYLISFVTILGRYIIKNVGNFFSKSKEFYFYSDKLGENNPSYQIENWSGVDDYVITINMNSNENNLLSASYDIEYSVSYTCSNNVICQLSKNTGTIYSSTNTDYFNLTITPNATLRTGDTAYIEITAVSQSTYEKTLRGRFTVVVGQERLSYEIVDQPNNTYLELNITNTLSYYMVGEAFNSYNVGDRININTYLALDQANKNKCYSTIVTLTFNPQQVLLDMTDNEYLNSLQTNTTIMNSYNYINSISFKVDAISSTTVRFYKIDNTQNYTYPNGNNSPVITLTNI